MVDIVSEPGVQVAQARWYDGDMLKIQVAGHVNTGKTTVATIIENALREHGINVRNLDPDQLNYASPDDLNERRLAAVVQRSRVEAVTVEVIQLAKFAGSRP